MVVEVMVVMVVVVPECDHALCVVILALVCNMTGYTTPGFLKMTNCSFLPFFA